MWHFDIVVMWQIKNVISPVSQGLWTPNLASWWFRMGGLYPTCHVTHWSHDHMTNQKRFISLFTRPLAPKLGRLLTQMRGSHPKSHVIFKSCGQVSNQIRDISSTTWPSRCKIKACARQKQTQKCQLELRMLRWSRSWLFRNSSVSLRLWIQRL